MAEIPSIIVQIIHMEGPDKGKIQELTDHEILIGRSADCQIRFPSDLKVISRKHAAIIRDGNRFKIVDTSSNGTIVNGKSEKEIFLKNGDVIAISQGGPKFSFLTQIGTGTVPSPPPPQPPQQPSPSPLVETQQPVPPPPPQQAPPQPTPVQQPVMPQPPQSQVAPQQVTPMQPVQPPPAQPTQQAPPHAQMQKVKAPLFIQYGPTLQNFDELPVIIGNQPGCQWHLDHPGIQGQQILIWFDQGQYWVKDLTGRGLVTVQGVPAGEGALLNPESQISFSPQGPLFKFLGNGRMAEVEAPPQQAPTQQPPAMTGQPPQYQNPVENMAENISKKAKNLLGKVWKK